MRVKKSILLWAGLCVVFCAAVFALFSSPTNPQNNLIKKPVVDKEPLISGFQFQRFDKGKKIYSLTAESFYLRNKKIMPFRFSVSLQKCAELINAKCEFYRNSSSVSEVFSRRAIMDMQKKDIIFVEAPAVVTQDKKVLTAEAITWNDKIQRLLAKGDCVLTDGNRHIKADSIEADIDLTKLDIKGEQDARAN
jgi:hypothetical protein